MKILGNHKSNFYNYLLIIIICLLGIITITYCEKFDKKKKGNKIINKTFYYFNMTNVNSFYHKAAITALLKVCL